MLLKTIDLVEFFMMIRIYQRTNMMPQGGEIRHLHHFKADFRAFLTQCQDPTRDFT